MEIATELLELKGAQVVQAWNGKEAVEQFEKSEQSFFDAILMDMQMPIMNGCEAAKAIRMPYIRATDVRADRVEKKEERR